MIYLRLVLAPLFNSLQLAHQLSAIAFEVSTPATLTDNTNSRFVAPLRNALVEALPLEEYEAEPLISHYHAEHGNEN